MLAWIYSNTQHRAKGCAPARAGKPGQGGREEVVVVGGGGGGGGGGRERGVGE